MEREKKIYLCVRSLMNVSQDLKEDYSDFSNMILFIADKIAEHEENRQDKAVYKIHGDGNIHDLSETKSCTCGDNEACSDESCRCSEPQNDDPDDEMIDKEIDKMIEMVRKEVKSDISD